MKNNFKFFLAILSVFFVLSACKKYEEGPMLTLLTKKARLTGDWKAEKTVSPSGVESFVNSFQVMKINKDNSYEIHEGKIIKTKGTWDFAKDKGYVRLTYIKEGITYIEEYEIIRLKDKELWWKDSQGIQVNFVPA